MNQNEYNLISWSLCDFCGVHILLMQNGIAIHMLTEKKYPLSQEMISKMLSKRLEVDQESTQAYELLKFIRSQVKKEIHDLNFRGSFDFIRLYDEVRARTLACALRNFDLEVMEFENTQNNDLAKLPMLKLGEYEMWEIRIKQHQPKVVQSTTTKMTVPVLTIEEKDYVNRNDVKASEVYSS
ncbi:hypothetical protein Tco_1057168 [Tanacetum coccineum]|uniref:Uncharacterized protein n=1 Tax=Tanacetum coccineum TaxID=301880 RepID=A0ABQ5H5L9_9ASTR